MRVPLNHACAISDLRDLDVLIEEAEFDEDGNLINDRRTRRT